MIYNMVNEYPLPVTPKFRGGSILTTPSSRAAGLRKAMDALPMAGCLLASSMTAEAGQPLRTQLGGTIRTVHDADALLCCRCPARDRQISDTTPASDSAQNTFHLHWRGA